MTMQMRLAVLCGGLFIFGIGLGIYGWQREHDARLKVETQTGTQQRQIDSLKLQQQQTRQTLDARLASIERQRTRPATAAQLVADAGALLPSLPAPLRIQAEPANAALPDGPTKQTLVIPEADFKVVRDAQLTCQENAAKLSACEEMQANAKQQLTLAEAQRDEWKAAARGGSLWHRAAGAVRWFVIGAGTGAAVYAISHHR